MRGEEIRCCSRQLTENALSVVTKAKEIDPPYEVPSCVRKMTTAKKFSPFPLSITWDDAMLLKISCDAHVAARQTGAQKEAHWVSITFNIPWASIKIWQWNSREPVQER